MLTGKRVFEAPEVSDILALVLTKEPEWQALSRATPKPVRTLLRRCLEKEQKRRLRDIGEARILLDDLEAGAPAADEARPRKSNLGWVAAAVMTVVALTFGVATLRRDAPANGAIRFSVLAPEGTTIAPGPAARQLALSPDGRRLVFAAIDSSGALLLWLRDMDDPEARPLPGTEGAWFPFWSPDGSFIGFQTPGQLKKNLGIGWSYPDCL
jgi:hypothetical protein